MAIYNLNNYENKDGFGMSLNIRRGNPNPLDNSSVWESLDAAENYAQTDPTAYVGQILTVTNGQTSTAYIIDNENGVLKAVGSPYTHPISGVTAGTYKSVTVNAQGHVTSGSNPTTLAGYGIGDAYTKTETNNKITSELNTFVSAYITSDGGAIDKLQEIANWIDSDKNGSADIIADVQANTQAISEIRELPDYSTANNNQFLRIVNGAPAWTSIPNAEEATF